MRASIYTCTRLGGDHDRNQDRALVGTTVHASTEGIEHDAVEAPTLLGVFDGLGGHQAGDVASDLVARFVAGAPHPRDEQALTTLLHQADDALQDAMRATPERYGMGTTAALLFLDTDPPQALVANVGDSTILRLTDDGFEELSVSDRWQGSSVLQCLGANDDGIAPHIRSSPVRAGDRLLISTDGLTDVVPAELLRTTLDDDAQSATARLLELVERAGTPDDLTFVLAELHD